MEKNLVLTGMMGVGKSTIGKKLAQKLKFKFVDIDRVIEEKEKNKIKDIFHKKGENYFRKLEKRITIEELKKNKIVLALGGGSIVNSVVRKEVKNKSISFWLDLDTKFLLKRLKNVNKRPLLSQNNLEETVNKIYSDRKKFYNEANYKIKCNSLDIDEIINKIIKLYETSKDRI